MNCKRVGYIHALWFNALSTHNQPQLSSSFLSHSFHFIHNIHIVVSFLYVCNVKSKANNCVVLFHFSCCDVVRSVSYISFISLVWPTNMFLLHPTNFFAFCKKSFTIHDSQSSGSFAIKTICLIATDYNCYVFHTWKCIRHCRVSHTLFLSFFVSNVWVSRVW